MGTEIPEYLKRMVCRPAPADEVVPCSTPVVAFGDPQVATVATLGLNPSGREFVEDGSLLSGSRRRLATLQSLGAESTSWLSDKQIRTVLEDCASYFRPDRNPYRRWFDVLDQVLRNGLGVNYYDGSACHLDLVQWATIPVWGKLSDRGVKQALLNESLPHLRNQLKFGKIQLVAVNGRQVLEQVVAVGLARLELSGTLRVGSMACSLYSGKGAGVQFVGWSTNLQSSFGVTRELKSQLERWLVAATVQKFDMEIKSDTDTESQNTPTETGGVLDADGHVVERTALSGKAELFRLLKNWLETSRKATIGVVGKFGGRPCIFIGLDEDMTAVLNVDTKRSAVGQFVEDVKARGPDVPWSVIPNRRGRLNKLTFLAGGAEVPGWYCYLRKPLSRTRKI